MARLIWCFLCLSAIVSVSVPFCSSVFLCAVFSYTRFYEEEREGPKNGFNFQESYLLSEMQPAQPGYPVTMFWNAGSFVTSRSPDAAFAGCLTEPKQ